MNYELRVTCDELRITSYELLFNHRSEAKVITNWGLAVCCLLLLYFATLTEIFFNFELRYKLFVTRNS